MMLMSSVLATTKGPYMLYFRQSAMPGAAYYMILFYVLFSDQNN